MTRYLLLQLILLLSLGGHAHAKTQRIAVLELSNPAGLTKQEVTYLSDLLRRLASSELAQSFLVIDKANVLELLPPEKTLEECIGACAVETGRLLQAAYIVTGDIIKFGKTLRVTIRMHDTSSGSLISSEVASGREVTDMEAGIQEAGGRLLRRLIRGAKASSEGGTKRRVIRGKRKIIGTSSSRRVIVTFTSEPEGAAIVIDGVQKCAEGKTDCKVELTEGSHQVSMTKTDYFIRSGSVNVSEREDEVEWSLDPNFATLKVYTTPSSLKFTVNDEEHQGSYSQKITPQKAYRVVSSDRCFDTSGEEVEAGKPGEVIEVNLKPSPLYAIIDVSAKSPQGEPLKAEIIVDGKELGMTPSQQRVSVCAKSLVVQHDVHGEYKSTLSLSEGETEMISGTIDDPTNIFRKKRNIYIGLAILVGLATYIAPQFALLGDPEHELVFRGSFVPGADIIVSLFVINTKYWYVPASKVLGYLSMSALIVFARHYYLRAEGEEGLLGLAPVIAPTNNGITFGFTGTF